MAASMKEKAQYVSWFDKIRSAFRVKRNYREN